ncbi:glutathione transferase gst 23 [Quercus suber]|uniref:glutathione transferase n=1 Tax=Quercus suber TaxID=58331 RepID=A0AAW0INC7_QUESU
MEATCSNGSSGRGEEQKKALKDYLEILKIVEEHGIGIVDIAFGINVAHWLGVLEEILEVKVLEAHALPRLHAWKENFEEAPAIKENLSNRDEMLAPAIWPLYRSTGEEQKKVLKDSLEMLKIVEDQGLGEKKFFGGDTIGIVDIAFGVLAHWFGVFEEVVEVKVLEAHAFPRLHAWKKNFEEVPVIKENLPDRGKMLDYFKKRRMEILSASQ